MGAASCSQSRRATSRPCGAAPDISVFHVPLLTVFPRPRRLFFLGKKYLKMIFILANVRLRLPRISRKTRFNHPGTRSRFPTTYAGPTPGRGESSCRRSSFSSSLPSRASISSPDSAVPFPAAAAVAAVPAPKRAAALPAPRRWNRSRSKNIPTTELPVPDLVTVRRRGSPGP